MTKHHRAASAVVSAQARAPPMRRDWFRWQDFGFQSLLPSGISSQHSPLFNLAPLPLTVFTPPTLFATHASCKMSRLRQYELHFQNAMKHHMHMVVAVRRYGRTVALVAEVTQHQFKTCMQSQHPLPWKCLCRRAVFVFRRKVLISRTLSRSMMSRFRTNLSSLSRHLRPSLSRSYVSHSLIARPGPLQNCFHLHKAQLPRYGFPTRGRPYSSEASEFNPKTLKTCLEHLRCLSKAQDSPLLSDEENDHISLLH